MYRAGLLGCVWIYGNYNFVAYNRPDVLSDLGKLSSEDKFCHQALYTVAFVVLTAFLIFFSAVIIGVVILSVYLCVQSSSKKF